MESASPCLTHRIYKFVRRPAAAGAHWFEVATADVLMLSYSYPMVYSAEPSQECNYY